MQSGSTKVSRGRPHGSSAEQTREKLLDAAAQEFSQRAFSDVSMAEIAKVAGLTSPAIYNHFASKDDLFQEMVKAIITRNIKQMNDVIDVDSDWKSQLAAILDLAASSHRNGFWAPLITSTAQLKIVREPEKFPEILRLREEYAGIFRTIAEKAVAAGDFQAETSVTIMGDLMMAMIANGLGAVLAHHPAEVDVQASIDCFRQLVLAQDTSPN